MVVCPFCRATYTAIPGRPGLCAKCGRSADPNALAQTAPRGMGAQRPAPPSMAYDPGYASIGHAPVFVQAKPSWARPGVVTAAGVIAIIAGALDIIGAIGWLTRRDIDGFFGGSHPEYTTYAIIDIFVAIFLLVGGVAVLGRAQWARYVLLVAAAGDATYSIIMTFNKNTGALLTIALDAVIIAAMLLPETTRYFRSRDPAQPF